MELIERQAALDIFDDYNVSVEMGELEAYSRDRKRLCELPAVQREERTEKRMEMHACDLISRQAVSSWLKQYGQDVLHGKYKLSLMYIWKNLMDLPSEQPETAKRIVGKSRDGMTLWYQCDMCNEPVDAKDNYCRGCGRMLIDG